MVTQERLKELFSYKDGQLIRNFTINHLSKKGSVAGSVSKRGYVVIRIDKKAYYAHRLVFLYHNGYMPEFIDHINHNKTDNKIENIRECTGAQNLFNKPVRSSNKLSMKNVSQRKFGSYRVRVNHPKGAFDYTTECLELAEFVAKEAREYYHGEFANHA